MRKAVFGISLSEIWHCQYPLQRSIDVGYFILPIQSNRSLWHGYRYKYSIVSLLSTQQSIQKCKELSGFFAKSTRGPHGIDEDLMAPNSNSSLTYYFTNNYSYGLWKYRPFCMGSMPVLSEIECMSPNFLFGGNT